MTEIQNIVTSKDVNSKTTKPKKATKEHKAADPIVKNGKLLIYFESGAGYVTKSGLKFSRENKMAEISAEEANLLLRLPNFRLPSDEEKEVYYNSQED